MRCPKCSTDNPEGENFCSNCGASIKSLAHVSIAKPAQSKRNHKIGLLLMMIGLAAIALSVLALIRVI